MSEAAGVTRNVFDAGSVVEACFRTVAVGAAAMNRSKATCVWSYV